jgi:hypothetical protein
MIERIQFWAVLLWMIGMLIMAAFAVRAVWREADRAAEEPGNEDHSGGRAGSGEPGNGGSQGSEAH